MKIHEMKTELEKVAKVYPELRQELDDAYASPEGKKRKIKLIWQEYEKRHHELRDSKQHDNLNLH